MDNFRLPTLGMERSGGPNKPPRSALVQSCGNVFKGCQLIYRSCRHHAPYTYIRSYGDNILSPIIPKAPRPVPPHLRLGEETPVLVVVEVRRRISDYGLLAERPWRAVGRKAKLVHRLAPPILLREV